MLGKRPLQPDPEEEAALQQAVASQIKRRRRSTNTTGAKVTLQERRAFDRATIEKIIKDNKPILKRWTDILEACLRCKVPQPFLRMQSIDDFTTASNFSVRPASPFGAWSASSGTRAWISLDPKLNDSHSSSGFSCGLVHSTWRTTSQYSRKWQTRFVSCTQEV